MNECSKCSTNDWEILGVEPIKEKGKILLSI